ncbi:MAG TPA: bifunctional dTDP-4-dehydrorhamnose 3,5-epimerase family protein/NAD(P)-dependent oxidoreductase [Candidatus Chromulinivoraceae bacterium]|nr:bifunctional dTDP-4-dehydrorhamnose 3,5-epimerase family protein/NAD(P)-dependent oxidoreductase [Candidatus Chromulinivoraceae bacterium]
MSEKAPLEFSKELKKIDTPIPGLIIFDLAIFGDNRGWFKENWQRQKMTTLGLPDFGPVQNNFSFNNKKGVLRGIHAEPWDKFISVGNGSFFGAWVDIREDSPTYGTTFTTEIDASKAIFVPAGVANSYLTLEDNTVYSYLVNDHWYPDASYTYINAADPELGITWPIPLDQCELSEKDKNHPMFKDITPIPAKKILITGSNGQLGKALQKVFPHAEFADRDELDITSDLQGARHWRNYSTIINAAAYTAVDTAETPEGKKAAWQVNGVGVEQLAKVATEYGITFVNVSSDYVFDGTVAIHDEDEQLSPLGVYAQSKAAGELITKTVPKHYLVRTSWVVGEGNNFVLTMKSLAERDIKPSVVDDQIGRLTFADDLARAIVHLITSKSPYGTYNVSNEGESVSWAEIAKHVFEIVGKNTTDITSVTTAKYYEGKEGIAPRPLQSTLNLAKIKTTGFTPRDWTEALHHYLDQQ